MLLDVLRRAVRLRSVSLAARLMAEGNLWTTRRNFERGMRAALPVLLSELRCSWEASSKPLDLERLRRMTDDQLLAEIEERAANEAREHAVRRQQREQLLKAVAARAANPSVPLGLHCLRPRQGRPSTFLVRSLALRDLSMFEEQGVFLGVGGPFGALIEQRQEMELAAERTLTEEDKQNMRSLNLGKDFTVVRPRVFEGFIAGPIRWVNGEVEAKAGFRFLMLREIMTPFFGGLLGARTPNASWDARPRAQE
jgi:hypothetical protein